MIEQEITLAEILLAREQRVAIQNELLSRHHAPVISFTMNIAGPVKVTGPSHRAFLWGCEQLRLGFTQNRLTVLEEQARCLPTGEEAYFAVDAPAETVKALCVDIEEGSKGMGRLFDMDVIGLDGLKLERGVERPCIVCGKPGRDCASRRLHSVSELQSATAGRFAQGLKDLDGIRTASLATRALLEEVAGYTMYRRNELRKAFILIGDKANGKSTFFDMVNTMLGSANTTALDLKELSDRFKTAEAAGKLAIIGDDIGDEFIPNPSIFKKLVSGDRINVERKGKDPFDFDNYSKLLFSANNIPRIKDKSGAVIDRLIIVPFRATFSPDDPDFDPDIKYKLRNEESIKYLIRIGINALSNVLERKRFTVSESMQKELKEYEVNNNPVLLFFAEDPKITDEPTSKVYRKYSEFCSLNGFQPISNMEFSKQVRKQYKVDIKQRKIRGVNYRVFVNREEDSNG